MMRMRDKVILLAESEPLFPVFTERRGWRRGSLLMAALLILSPSGWATKGKADPAAETGWSVYGGNLAGQRFSAARQIDRENVRELRPVWTVHTGALRGNRPWQERAAFEATPILSGDTLYLSTPYDQVLALDPATGAEKWRYDPHVQNPERGIITSRGVSVWPAAALGSSQKTQLCATRIFLGTLDARLIALDGQTGRPCADFGAAGAVNLLEGTGGVSTDEYEVTSAPTVVGDVVVTGSSIGDNRHVDEPRGVVRGYDVRTGRLLWSWNPVPWAERAALRTGGGNAWSTIAADAERGILYVPTSSPSPDFYGGYRPGDNRDADSLVALDARTGRKLWAFQVVHHDLWDYDLAAEPVLFEMPGPTRSGAAVSGATVPAVAIATKTGKLFVFNRVTGAPLDPVSERPVPGSDVGGEESSPTQPFSSLSSLTPDHLPLAEAWGPTPADREFCRDKMAGLRNEGIFTPPSREGTLVYPGSLGGVNWGSLAFDPGSGRIYANVNRQPFLVRLGPRKESWWHDNVSLPLSSWLNECHVHWIRNSRPFRWLLSRFYPDEGFQADPEKKINNPHFGKEYSQMGQTPYVVIREPLVSPSGLPCSPPPWGTISAVNLYDGKFAWQTALGSMDAQHPGGSVSLGGPMVTAAGLVFTAAAKDPHLRAFDAGNGELLWTATLPVPAQATPMTYVYQGRQFVVIAAGGHGSFGTEQGDSVIAFGLPEGSPAIKAQGN